MVSELGSQPQGSGFESRLFQILHGTGVKTMPGSIPIAPSPGSETENKEIKKTLIEIMFNYLQPGNNFSNCSEYSQ